MLEHKMIALSLIEQNTGQVAGLPANPRQWRRDELDNLKKSIAETPELLEARGLIVYPHEGKYIVLGGNMRRAALAEMKAKEAPCIVVPEGTEMAKLKAIVVKDNGAFGEWDYDSLANEWDDQPLGKWGVPAWDVAPDKAVKEGDADEVEQKRMEFEEKMRNGEIAAEDEEYKEFVDKFQLKKTTDDCYTPASVHEAVMSFVEKKYHKERKNFVRPFYPGGNYQSENYPAGCVVVDNPPFSILTEITRFYDTAGISFFLYAPQLTIFSPSQRCTALPVGVQVTYENGAQVNTGFITNLEPSNIRIASEPELYRMVYEANKENLKEQKKHLPKYIYDKHVATSILLARFSRLGVAFEVPVAESIRISELDSMKAEKRTIFGCGYLLSERLTEAREEAERECKAREREEGGEQKKEEFVWELSDRERAIIQRLNQCSKEAE